MVRRPAATVMAVLDLAMLPVVLGLLAIVICAIGALLFGAVFFAGLGLLRPALIIWWLMAVGLGATNFVLCMRWLDIARYSHLAWYALNSGIVTMTFGLIIN